MPPCDVCGAHPSERILDASNTLFECPRCGMVTRDLNSAPANHRNAAYGGDPDLDAARLHLTYRTLRSLLKRPNPRVFEIGFGSGALLARFRADGASIAGTDPDQLGVDLNPLIADDPHLAHLPVEKIGPDDIGYDLVYGVHVIEHVESPAVALRSAARLLADGGTLAFITPAGDCTGLSTYGAAWWMLEDPTHVRFFTAQSLRRLAHDAGLRDITVTRPIADSLMTDVASLTRKYVYAQGNEAGALHRPWVRVIGVASVPFVLIWRVLRPRSRASLMLVARR